MTQSPEGQQSVPPPLPVALQPASGPAPVLPAEPATYPPVRSGPGRVRRALSRTSVGLLNLGIGSSIVVGIALPGTVAAVHSAAPRLSALQLLTAMVSGGATHPPTFASLSTGIAILLFGLGAALTWVAAAVEAVLGDLDGPLAVIAGNLTWVLGVLVLSLASLHEVVVPWLASELFDENAVRLDLGWAGVACLLVAAFASVRLALVQVSGAWSDRALRGLQLFVATTVGVALFAGGVLDESLTSTGLTVAGLAGSALFVATDLAGWLAWALALLVAVSVIVFVGSGRTRRGSARVTSTLLGAIFSVTLAVSAALLVALNLAYSASGTAESASYMIPFRPANWYLISALVLSLALLASAFLPRLGRQGIGPSVTTQSGGSQA